MEKCYVLFRKVAQLFTIGICLTILGCQIAQAQATRVTNPTNTQIVTALTGTGLGISSPSLGRGQNSQIATFSNGIAGAGFGMDAGVLFSTGNAGQDLTNKNNVPNRTNNPASTGTDPQLVAINPTATFNTMAYSFDITLDANVSGIRIIFQFGSEEYPDFVGSVYNDVFGFFVSGPGITGTQNFALLPSNNDVIAVNSVNGGVLGYYGTTSPANLSQTEFYINNGHRNNGTPNPETQPGPFPVHIEYNGITKAITKDIGGLTPGATYRFKVAIADVGDASYDSGVLLRQIIGLKESDLQLEKTVNNETPMFGETVAFTLTATNNGPNDAAQVNVHDLLPSGYTYVSALASKGAYDPLAGVWAIGEMAVTDVETLVIQAMVRQTGDHLNLANIEAGNAVDPDQTNNYDEASVTPVPAILITNPMIRQRVIK